MLVWLSVAVVFVVAVGNAWLITTTTTTTTTTIIIVIFFYKAIFMHISETEMGNK